MEHGFGNLDSLKTSQKAGEDQVSNPFAAFAHGLIHSVENSYNGVAQLTGGNVAEIKISRSVDSDSGLAQASYVAGELVGTGAQLLTIGRVLPQSKSIVGHVARSGAVGALYGGVLQPSEGVNLGEERVKNGISMGAFMTVFEVGKLGAFGAGLNKWTAAQGLVRGSLAGGLAGASHEVTNSALNGTDLTLAGMGSSMTKGALMGSAMELGGTALVRSNLRNIAAEGTFRSSIAKQPLESLAQGPRDPVLLKGIRDAAKAGDVPNGKSLAVGMLRPGDLANTAS